MVVHTESDEFNGMIGKLHARIRLLEGFAAALKIAEALWYSADAEARKRAERWTGWKRWQDAIRRAIEWE